MGVFQRPRSPYWWLWIPGAPKGTNPVKTQIPIGVTPTERKVNKQTAEQVLATRVLQAGKLAEGLPVESAPTTFATFAGWYETHQIPQHRGAYRERQILPRLVAAFGELELAQVNAERVIEWRTMRLKTPTMVKHYGGPNGKPHIFPRPSARTVNREVGFLQQILAAAVEAKLLAISPLLGLPDLPTAPVRRRTMSLDEERRLLPALSVDDRAIFLIGLDELVRLGDILDLRRADDHGDSLDVGHPKNGVPLSVPLSARVRAALDAVPIDPANPEWYFPHRRQAKTDQARTRGYIKALARACARAGVPYGKAAAGVTFHWSTRRTGATRMIRAGGEKVLGVVQQIGGWKDVSVLIGIYQETITEEMRAAVETVSAPPTQRSRPKLRRVK
jgi:integrase